ncbi:MAG: oxidoreductase [Legionellaceae bacterium]|nr:oxidoreductase [Legionellaceae bacterium]
MGCGRIVKKHADALTSGQLNAELVAVCDPDKNRAQTVGQAYQVPAYPSIQALCEQHKVDVVCILTPSGLHAKHTLEVATLKKHVVVEKPMALTLTDADAMIRACDKSGVKLFVVKQNRYNKPVVKLREALEAGRFGQLTLGTVRVRWCRPQAYYDQDAWRGTWAMDGGVFTNQASHHIDLLEWMMGDVESVFAKSSTRLVNIEVEDTGVAILKFKSGALGLIEATTATRPKDLEGSLSILGEGGTVEIAGFAVNQMKTWNFVTPIAEDADVLKHYSQNPLDVYGFGHAEYLKNVIDCILHDKKALVDGLEGRRSLELIHAIYESIESHQEVKLGLKPLHCSLGIS